MQHMLQIQHMPKSKEDTPPFVQVRISARLHRELKYEAIRLGISNTKVLDKVIGDYLSANEATPIDPASREKISDLVYVRMSGEVHKPLKIQALLWGISITDAINAMVRLYMTKQKATRRN